MLSRGSSDGCWHHCSWACGAAVHLAREHRVEGLDTSWQPGNEREKGGLAHTPNGTPQCPPPPVPTPRSG